MTSHMVVLGKDGGQCGNVQWAGQPVLFGTEQMEVGRGFYARSLDGKEASRAPLMEHLIERKVLKPGDSAQKKNQEVQRVQAWRRSLEQSIAWRTSVQPPRLAWLLQP